MAGKIGQRLAVQEQLKLDAWKTSLLGSDAWWAGGLALMSGMVTGFWVGLSITLESCFRGDLLYFLSSRPDL